MHTTENCISSISEQIRRTNKIVERIDRINKRIDLLTRFLHSAVLDEDGDVVVYLKVICACLKIESEAKYELEQQLLCQSPQSSFVHAKKQRSTPSDQNLDQLRSKRENLEQADLSRKSVTSKTNDIKGRMPYERPGQKSFSDVDYKAVACLSSSDNFCLSTKIADLKFTDHSVDKILADLKGSKR